MAPAKKRKLEGSIGGRNGTGPKQLNSCAEPSCSLRLRPTMRGRDVREAGHLAAAHSFSPLAFRILGRAHPRLGQADLRGAPASGLCFHELASMLVEDGFHDDVSAAIRMFRSMRGWDGRQAVAHRSSPLALGVPRHDHKRPTLGKDPKHAHTEVSAATVASGLDREESMELDLLWMMVFNEIKGDCAGFTNISNNEEDGFSSENYDDRHLNATLMAELQLWLLLDDVKFYNLGVYGDYSLLAWENEDKTTVLLSYEATEEILGADQGAIEACTPGEKIDNYIYQQFQLMREQYLTTWRKKLFLGMDIIPPVRMQAPGECTYNATVAAMESRFKAAYAVRPFGQKREFTIRLSVNHLKSMVEKYYSSKKGESAKGSQRLEICLKMAQLHGVMSEEDFEADHAAGAERTRYSLKSYHMLSNDEMKSIDSYLDDGEVILTSFRISREYDTILPQEIYRYRAANEQRDTTNSGKLAPHNVHVVVLTGYGDIEKYQDGGIEKDQDGDAEDIFETYYEYLNRYSHRWGIDGFGFLYADSLRQTYRLAVEC